MMYVTPDECRTTSMNGIQLTPVGHVPGRGLTCQCTQLYDPTYIYIHCMYRYTCTHFPKCLQIFIVAVYFIQSILSVAICGSVVACSIGQLLLKVPSSTVEVVGQVCATPTLALSTTHPEGGVFGLTKLDPLPTYEQIGVQLEPNQANNSSDTTSNSSAIFICRDSSLVISQCATKHS